MPDRSHADLRAARRALVLATVRAMPGASLSAIAAEAYRAPPYPSFFDTARDLVWLRRQGLIAMTGNKRGARYTVAGG